MSSSSINKKIRKKKLKRVWVQLTARVQGYLGLTTYHITSYHYIKRHNELYITEQTNLVIPTR